MPAKKQTAKKPAPANRKDVFVYANPFPKGEDDDEVPARAGRRGYVKKARFAGKPVLVVEPKALTRPRARGDARRVVPPPPEAPAAGRRRSWTTPRPRRTTGSWRRRSSGTPSSRRSSSCRSARTRAPRRSSRWKGQQVWTGADDAEMISKGIWKTYTEENLRYSQTAALNMYDEVNTGNNLPAQIDIYATPGDGVQVPLRREGRRLGEQERTSSRRRRRS